MLRQQRALGWALAGELFTVAFRYPVALASESTYQLLRREPPASRAAEILAPTVYRHVQAARFPSVFVVRQSSFQDHSQHLQLSRAFVR